MTQDQNHTYPQYYKATDAEDRVTALLCAENKNAITILAKQGARFLIQRVATWEDVRMTIGGQISLCEPQLYHDTLYTDWNFGISDCVLEPFTNVVTAPVLDTNAPVPGEFAANSQPEGGEQFFGVGRTTYGGVDPQLVTVGTPTPATEFGGDELSTGTEASVEGEEADEEKAAAA